MTRAVILDAYGTILSCPWPEFHAMLGSRFGLSAHSVRNGYLDSMISRETGAYADAGENMGAVLRSCGYEASRQECVEAAAMEAAFLAARVRLFADAVRALAMWRSAGRRLAVVSNCSVSTLPVLDRLAVPDLVDAITLSFQVGMRKPASAVFESASASIGCTPIEALYVDDDPKQSRAGSRLGFTAFTIRRGEPNCGSDFVATLLDPMLH